MLHTKTLSLTWVISRLVADTSKRYNIKTKECFGKAGAYAIQGIGRDLVEKYEGSLNNIIGLPTEKLEEILGEINGMEN